MSDQAAAEALVAVGRTVGSGASGEEMDEDELPRRKRPRKTRTIDVSEARRGRPRRGGRPDQDMDDDEDHDDRVRKPYPVTDGTLTNPMYRWMKAATASVCLCPLASTRSLVWPPVPLPTLASRVSTSHH